MIPTPTTTLAPTSFPPRTATRRGAARQTVGLASLGAGVIHLALGPAHMTEWTVLGYGFFATGAVQLLVGAALLRAESRRLLALASMSSVVLILMWLASRTTGLPVGPEAGHPEALGRADLLCIGLESVVALGALTLLRRPTAGLAPAGRGSVRRVVAAAAAAVLTTTGVAVAAPGHGHSDNGCPTSPVRSGVDANDNGADDGVERYFACQLHEGHADHEG